MTVNINQVIDEVLEGKRELDAEFEPDFYEQPFADGADEVYIGHFAEGTENMLYFPEKEHIIEARNKNWMGDLTDEELNELLEGINGLDDRFDYDKVVAFTDDIGMNWI